MEPRWARLMSVTACVLLLCGRCALAEVDFTKEFESDENTVLLLHFNEEESPKDSSGKDHKVALKGAKLTKEGKFGGGLDASGGMALVPHAKTLVIEDAMTVEMWIKPTAEDVGKRYHTLAHKRSVQKQRLYLTIHNGCLAAYPGVRGKTKLKADKWYHVAYIVTGQKKWGGREYLFINGVLDAEQPSVWEGMVDKCPLRIGGLSKKTESLKGKIDEVRISNIARPYPSVPKKEKE